MSSGRCTEEAFHFVSYIPLNGHLFEIDGLKPYPIDHGPWAEHENWTEKCRRVVSERLNIASGDHSHEIRFNLMTVVPDRRLAISRKLKILNANKEIVLDAIQKLVNKENENREINNDDKPSSSSASNVSSAQTFVPDSCDVNVIAAYNLSELSNGRDKYEFFKI